MVEVIEVNTVVGPYGWGRIDMVGEPPGRHQEPGDLRVPGGAGADHGPRRPRVVCPSVTSSGRRPASSPVTPSSSTTAVVLAPEGGLRRLHRREPARRPVRCAACEPGNCYVNGRRSPHSLYDFGLATYDAEDSFRHGDSAGLCASGAWASRPGAPPGPGLRRRASGGDATWHGGRFAGGPAEELLATVSLPFDRRLAADDLVGSRATCAAWSVPGSSTGTRPRPCSRARHGGGGARRRHVPPSGRATGHPHRGRAAGDRAGRPAGAKAPHRPQPQRPGRHRPAPVHRWSWRWSGRGCSTSSAPCWPGPRRPATSTAWATPTSSGPSRHPGAPPPGPRLGPRPRYRPPARRPAPPRRVAPRRRRPRGIVTRPGSGRRGRRPRVRPTVRELLGAVSDRDFVAESLFAPGHGGPAPVAAGEEVVLWTSEEFGFARLDDAYATGSLDAAAEEEPRHRRAGPRQGRPPRGQPHRPAGDAQRACPRLQPRPAGGQRSPLRLAGAGQPRPDWVVDGSLATLRWDHERMRAAADLPTTAATDLAEFLVRAGMPFRDAHAVVGGLVRQSLGRRRRPRRPRGRPPALGPGALALAPGPRRQPDDPGGRPGPSPASASASAPGSTPTPGASPGLTCRWRPRSSPAPRRSPTSTSSCACARSCSTRWASWRETQVGRLLPAPPPRAPGTGRAPRAVVDHPDGRGAVASGLVEFHVRIPGGQNVLGRTAYISSIAPTGASGAGRRRAVMVQLLGEIHRRGSRWSTCTPPRWARASPRPGLRPRAQPELRLNLDLDVDLDLDLDGASS